MRLYKEFNPKLINAHNILFTTTSERDYEMNRLFILEEMPKTSLNEFVLVEGYHCSCYGFDETKWEATVYNKEELIKILSNSSGYEYLRKDALNFIKRYLNEIEKV